MCSPPTVVGSRPVRGLLLYLLTLLSVAPAAAQELARRDRLAILYSNQVVFDRKGEPLVSVRITEGQRSIRVRSKGRLELLPGADGGSRLTARAGAEWVVSVEAPKRGKVRWWVVAERLPANDIIRAAARRTHYQKLGHTVAMFESGALIGLAGDTLDTRQITVALDPQPTAEAARAKASTMTGVTTDIVDESVERPGGWLVAREKRSGVVLRARDLLWITPQAGAAVQIPELEWGHGTPKRGRATRSYQGDVYLAIGNDGTLTAVNLVSAETLLEGVVPSELYPAAPMAALKAQAVAARGQLLAKIGTRHRADPYLLCAETHCQVYSGESKVHPRTTRAVRETRGELLFDDEGLVDTVYSSSCGGHSEAFDVYWGGAPRSALPGRHDVPNGSTDPVTDVAAFLAKPNRSWCGFQKKLFRWSKTRSGKAVTAAVRAYKDIGPVHTIKPLRRGRSGRVLAVSYAGPKGTFVLEGAYKNRILLGRLRSGLWQHRREGGAAGGQPARWVFKGGGFGHGVGMCQHGAMGMARAKKSHADILTHYYVGSRLRRAW